MGLLDKFFKIAKVNCCNYAATGPGGKPDYCYPGPHSCCLKEDKFCDWFDQAVIAYGPFRREGLQAEWQELWQGTPGKIINKLCMCGEEFRPTASRQRLCVKCRGLNQKEKARMRMRKMRQGK